MWDNTAAYDGHRIITSAIVGGTVSKLNGGKFENGAVSGAMIQAFNAEGQLERARAKLEEYKNSLEEYYNSGELKSDAARAFTIIGGAAQVGAGFMLCTTPATCVAGVGLMTLGADNIIEGSTGIGAIRGALNMGFDSNTADAIHFTLNVGTSGVLALKQVPKVGLIGYGERSTEFAISQASKLELYTELGAAWSGMESL